MVLFHGEIFVLCWLWGFLSLCDTFGASGMLWCILDDVILLRRSGHNTDLSSSAQINYFLISNFWHHQLKYVRCSASRMSWLLLLGLSNRVHSKLLELYSFIYFWTCCSPSCNNPPKPVSGEISSDVGYCFNATSWLLAHLLDPTSVSPCV